MTDRLLLDTHIVLWLDSGNDRLRPQTRALVDECWQNGGAILISAISVWEIALLVDTGRIDLDLPVDAWVKRFMPWRRLRPAWPSRCSSELPASPSRASGPGRSTAYRNSD